MAQETLEWELDPLKRDPRNQRICCNLFILFFYFTILPLILLKYIRLIHGQGPY
jgi:hypothetical protein